MSRIGSLALFLLLVAPACFAQPPDRNPPPQPSQTGDYTCTVGLSGQIVKVTQDGTNRIIKANRCPWHDWTTQTTPNTAEARCTTYTLPLKPTISKNKIYVSVFQDLAQTTKVTTEPIKGAIGVTANGVDIFGGADADNDDAYVEEAKTFDVCGGHVAPGGFYHYHSEPVDGCVYKDNAGEHSGLMGFMFDGIPIYGTKGDNGVIPTDLDECNGHVDKTHPFYHYHVTPNFKYPYLMNCLKGCVDTTQFPNLNQGQSCDPAATQYDYSSINNVLVEADACDCGSVTSCSTTKKPAASTAPTPAAATPTPTPTPATATSTPATATANPTPVTATASAAPSAGASGSPSGSPTPAAGAASSLVPRAVLVLVAILSAMFLAM